MPEQKNVALSASHPPKTFQLSPPPPTSAQPGKTAQIEPSPRTSQPPTAPTLGERIVSGLSAVTALTHLTQLSSAAQTLNELSDQLTQRVAAIETPLNKLNLGIWARVPVTTLYRSEDGTYEHGLQLVYGKHSGKWGFLIDEFHQDLDSPDQSERESWSFKDAPREFRIKAVDKIPALLQALVERSGEVASEITKKVRLAEDLANAISLTSPSGSKK